MTTELLVKKLNKVVGVLKEEVRGIKRILLAPLKDPEGQYKKSFINKVLSREKSSGPFYRFTDKESFLKHVRSKK